VRIHAINGKSRGGEQAMPMLQWKERFGPGFVAQRGLTASRAFFVALLLVLYLTPGANAEPTIPNASGPAIFHGEIAKGLRIEMKLYRDGSNLHGTYLYEVFGRNIEVRGTIDEHGEIALREFIKGKVTGNFDGRFVSDNRIEGRWYKKSGEKGRGFYLVGTGAPLTAAPVQASPKPMKEDREVSSAPKEMRSVAKAETPLKAAPVVAEVRPQNSANVNQPNAPAKREMPVARTPVPQPQPLKTEPAKVEPMKAEPIKTEPAKLEPSQAPSAPQIALRPAVAEEPIKPAPAPEVRSAERPRVTARSAEPAPKKSSVPWVNFLFDMKVGGAIVGVLLLGGGLAWLAVIAGGSAALRENSALFREVHAMGISFLPGIVLLALGVGAVLAVFVE
jgi:hypothetical protein